MNKVFADLSKNRLYIILGTVSSEDETRFLVNRVLNEVKKLRHGFTCITDLREFSLSNGINDDFMQDCQEILWEGGIRKAIRITGVPDTGFCFDFEKKSKVWPAYQTDQVFSMEEAESSLDSLSYGRK
ncbi:hypothetical protein [Desulforegula conservatrix]|uniref:hypothetical protein n=1 Tax=Desulforegula conservatrix TaxID=153026 RepID=UPI0004062C65|nr:hypothetical protein [Desulforegula conservatrix]